MKNSGRNLRRRLQMLGNRISRIKHRKGHGVHSPFVYGFVRKVLMTKTLCEESGTALYDTLLANDVAEKRARELHNTLCYIEGQSYSINEVECDLSILLEDYPTEQLRAAYEEAKRESVTLAIYQPYLNRERQNEVKALIDEHRSTTIDNRAYILFFNNRLPKQHYRL
ncbi:MAG: hypothetical protein II214_02755 [Alistipes sp.]|nr:hypothetical protein [Alistipes sp.]